MKNSTFTPEQSLLLISEIIEDSKERFKQNGHIIVFWGALTFVVFGSQLLLSMLELYKFTMLPVYLFPLGGVYMLFIWIKERKQNVPKTLVGNILGNLGWIIGMNLMIMGFFFTDILGEATAPVFLIFLALFIMTCGLTIKFKPLLWGGIVLNLIGLGSFFFEMNYHGYSMMLGAVVGLIIPGILLNIERRNENV